jgi:hypothetical protein
MHRTALFATALTLLARCRLAKIAALIPITRLRLSSTRAQSQPGANGFRISD